MSANAGNRILSHTLGFPRIGVQRQLKRALEAYWSGAGSEAQLRDTGRQLRLTHWKQQMERGVDLIPVGDFHWYDHVLGTSLMLGNVPQRHRVGGGQMIDMDTHFRVARGHAVASGVVEAAEMTKWFNTNYHYIVPEFTGPEQTFNFAWRQIHEEVDELMNICEPYRVKPVLLGPLTYLWLGKVRSNKEFDRLVLLHKLVPVYAEVLCILAKCGVEWVQMDEPALVLDLSEEWLEASRRAYETLRFCVPQSTRLMLTTYFDGITHNIEKIKRMPVDGLHVDAVAGRDDLLAIERSIPAPWVLSVGMINGRNVWRTNLQKAYAQIAALRRSAPGRALWVGTSCSLLHIPIDLDYETTLDAELRSWLGFALQKCAELSLLARSLESGEKDMLIEYSAPAFGHDHSKRSVNAVVRRRITELVEGDERRPLPYVERNKIQRDLTRLPLFPTTTVGSFPQTSEIRSHRMDFKGGIVDEATYKQRMREHIKHVVKEQETIGLDVLVHGEPERCDMVEYFTELMDGFALTTNGWVQSYGSRCVKPPIIYGDVSRPKAMTVEWSVYAQSLTKRAVKGILTGPTTILLWSFPREDLPYAEIAKQIALALRDEVSDLQEAGMRFIQVDEPALREGLPLRRNDWPAYLRWVCYAFKLTVAVARPETQIHTHICYSELQDIIATVAEMDTVESMVRRMEMAAAVLPPQRLWVSPDCGLKTRKWEEVRPSLRNMVAAAQQLRVARETDNTAFGELRSMGE
uniref:5-methyltetrahydropteroyltriglutamate--homocysteine S-methyltransferase n=1 Tax=Trypanosoma vivax (strain Y486) TaxID=1055687 RepID=G0U0K4_TRYVY|nr:putative 5-methyltetrahydropteroyltriglutamate-homocystein e S-methyltransferase [Trypanosoma vivax Y486]